MEGTDMANKENIRKWVAALRSGKYKQGKGKLFSADNTYCPFGVAAVISGSPLSNIMSRAYPLPSTLVWLGLEAVSTPVQGKSLITWNDSVGWTFDQIADAIEEQFLPEDAAARESEDQAEVKKALELDAWRTAVMDRTTTLSLEEYTKAKVNVGTIYLLRKESQPIESALWWDGNAWGPLSGARAYDNEGTNASDLPGPDSRWVAYHLAPF